MSLISIARLSPVINAATKAEGDTASAKSLVQGLTPFPRLLIAIFIYYPSRSFRLNESYIYHVQIVQLSNVFSCI